MIRFTTQSSLATAFVLALALALWSTPAGAQPFRISFMGPDGNGAFDAAEAAVAYDPVQNRYLAVWSGSDDGDGQVQGEFEIFVRPASGDGILGARLRLSSYGGLGDADFDAVSPDIVYNPDAHEYLVVWATRNAGVPGPLFARRIDAAALVAIGDEIELTSGTRAERPAVAYNPATEEYLVAWRSDDAPDLAQDEYEIFVRRLAGSTAAPLGAGGVRISTMGTDLDPASDAESLDVAADATQGRYVVVWSGDDTPGEYRVFAQGLNSLGAEIGTDDRDITNVPAGSPQIAFNPLAGFSGEYLVVWDDPFGGIYGRRINALSLIPLAGDLLLSGTESLVTDRPAVAARSGFEGWVVAWKGGDPGLGFNEKEIFATAVGALGGTTGRTRVSEAGGTGNEQWEVEFPALAAGPSDAALVVWTGEDDQFGLSQQEYEAFGRALALPIFFDGFESGNTAAWSAEAGD